MKVSRNFYLSLFIWMPCGSIEPTNVELYWYIEPEFIVPHDFINRLLWSLFIWMSCGSIELTNVELYCYIEPEFMVALESL